MRLSLLVLAALLVACPKKAPPASSGEGEEPAALSEKVEAWPGLAAAPHGTPEGGWTHDVRADHPLVGALWSVREGRFTNEASVREAASSARFVLLGEKHDNADHHRLQARFVQALVQPGVPVVFEMLDEDDAAALSSPGGPSTPAELAEVVAWADSGWPAFTLYEPVFAALFARGASVVAGHPTRETLKTAMMEGLEALEPGALEDLRLESSEDSGVTEAYAQEIRDAHCGYAPEAIVPAMVLGQRLKDAWLARALRHSAQSPAASEPMLEPAALLIAGGGHARLDRAVPLYLEDSVTIAFVEVPRTGFDLVPEDLAEQADYVWFTPRVDDEDPCAAFAEQLKNLGPVE